MSCGKKCKSKCCCNQNKLTRANYVYASILGDIGVGLSTERFLGFQPGDDMEVPWRCIRGHLEGFDPMSGTFTAPRTAVYDVNAWITYCFCVPGTTGFTGATNTEFVQELKQNICGAPGARNVAPVAQTSPYITVPAKENPEPTTFAVSNSSLGGSIPLRKGETLRISVYQQNSYTFVEESGEIVGPGVGVQIFAEWMIIQGPYIDLGTCRGSGCGVV